MRHQQSRPEPPKIEGFGLAHSIALYLPATGPLSGHSTAMKLHRLELATEGATSSRHEGLASGHRISSQHQPDSGETLFFAGMNTSGWMII